MSERDCPECDGRGWVSVTVSRCCSRSEYECGGRGCTGPEPEEEQDGCSFCRGFGAVEDAGEEVPAFEAEPWFDE